MPPPSDNSGQDIRKWKKEKKYVRKDDAVFTLDGNPTDRVIAVMGPTGVGKSTFINALLKKGTMAVGHDLTSCTAKIQHTVVEMPREKKRNRVIILDTPGFDDTYVDDAEILRRTSVWLATSYVKHMGLTGILYLADITQPRMNGSVRENIEVMKDLCGRDQLKSVVCVTTKWSGDPSEQEREQQLKTKYLVDMLNSGASLERFNGTYESARNIVEYVLREDHENKVRLQVELVDQSKYIPETSAGRRLRTTLAEFLQKQRERKLPEDQIVKTQKAIQTLDKRSMTDKFKDFLKLW